MILFDQGATASTNPQGLIQKAWVRYKGNTSWPQPGSAEYLAMLMIANDFKNNWALDANVHWDSLYEDLLTVGTIVANTQAYPLPNNVYYLSDYVYILQSNGINTDRFQVVHPEQQNNYNDATGTIASDYGDPVCFLTGSFQLGASNLTLNFVEPFEQTSGGTTSYSSDVGGTIQLGCYVLPADMVNPTDVVPINNPNWLVQILAAEMARNDPAKEDRYADLLQEANDIYAKMVKDNQGNSYQQPNSPSIVQQQIGATWPQI